MAVKKGNKTVQVTLTQFHKVKLDIIKARMGLSYTGMVQRWIEQFDLFDTEKRNWRPR